MPEVGFDGNPDLYGIGIRVGYYSAAISLWISNLWAPTEIYFLQPLTLTFLAAVLVAVSVQSTRPDNTYAIEPFMMMQIAYYTLYMSYSGYHPPEFLRWEKPYFKYWLHALVALGLHIYDTWYWWIGLWKFKPTPGAETFGLFTYFGQQNIFGWITIVARIFTALVIISILVGLLHNVHKHGINRRMDREIPVARFKQIAERWVTNLDPFGELNARDADDKAGKTNGQSYLSPAMVSRQPSKSSVRSAPVRTTATPFPATSRERMPTIGSVSTHDSRFGDYDYKNGLDEKAESHKRSSTSAHMHPPEPQQKIERTNTGRWKRRLLGWQDEPVLAEYQHQYTPSLEGVSRAIDLLHELNTKDATCRYKFLWAMMFPYVLIFKALQSLPTFCSRKIRPKSLIAVTAHFTTLGWTKRKHWFDIFRLALRSPNYRLVSPYDISLASRIILTTEPIRDLTKWELFNFAWFQFGSCALLVIGTELALQWSHVRNVHDFKTVGQLIPAAIGLGGFVKVIWTATMDRDRAEKWCFGKCRGDKKRAEWMEASEVYERARLAWEKKRDVDDGPVRGEKEKLDV